jgi:hypothetical protein
MEYFGFTKYMERDDELQVCGFDEIYARRPVTLTVTEIFVTLTQFNEITPREHEAGLLELCAESMKSSSILASAGFKDSILNCR